MQHSLHFSTKWAKLLKFRLHHDFYEDNLCPDIEYRPTAASATALEKLGILFRQLDHGFILLAQKENLLAKISHKYQKINQINIQAFAKNYSLYNFTEIPLNHVKKFHYLSTRNCLKAENNEWQLNDGKPIDFRSLPEFRTTKKFLDEFLNKQKKTKKLRIVNFHDHQKTILELGEQHLSDPDYLLGSLAYLPEEVYTIIDTDSSTYHINQQPSESHSQIPPLFTLGIPLHENKKESQLYSAKAITPKNYTVALSTRKTHWKYVLHEAPREYSKGTITDIKVMYKDQELDFTKPEDYKTIDGRDAKYIQSKNPLPLQEIKQQSDKLTLKLKRDGKWASKYLKAPLPQREMVKPGNDNKIYSITYLNI